MIYGDCTNEVKAIAELKKWANTKDVHGEYSLAQECVLEILKKWGV